MAKNTNIPDVPGCIYLNKNRYWWRVKLPGQDNYTAMPLKPVGSKLATTDLNTAKEIARNRWEQAIYSGHNKQIESCDTIGSLAAAYFQYIEIYYRRADGGTTGESERIRWGIKTFLEMYAALKCEEFGPLKLEKVRDQLIKSGTSRKVINVQIGMIKRMFKWGASKQLVPVYIYQGLQTLAVGNVCPCDLTPLSFGNIFEETLASIWERMGQIFSKPRCGCFSKEICRKLKLKSDECLPLNK